MTLPVRLRAVAALAMALAGIFLLGWSPPASAQTISSAPGTLQLTGLAATGAVLCTDNNDSLAGGQACAGGAVLLPQRFGAICDGQAHDGNDAAMQAWAAAVTTGATAMVQGQCVFTQPITFPIVSSVSLLGQGKNSELIYAGTATTGNMVTIGDANGDHTVDHFCSTTGWTIHDIKLMSDTVMTGGSALTMNFACEADIENLTVGQSLNGNTKWWNAVWFNDGNTIRMRGCSLISRNIGLLANGYYDAASMLSNQQTDLYVSQCKAQYAAIGIDVAGNVGGLTIDQMDMLTNVTNVQVDQSVVPYPNQQLFFGPGAAMDASSGPGIGFNIIDPGQNSAQSQIFFTGSWLASTKSSTGDATGTGGQCLYLHPLTGGVSTGAPTNGNWNISFSGGTLTNCQSDAIRIDDANSYITMSGTWIRGSQGYGVNQTVANPHVSIQGVHWAGNLAGDFSALAEATQGVDSNGDVVVQAANNRQVAIGPAQQNGLWIQQGFVLPGSSDGKTAGGSTRLGSTTYPFAHGYFTQMDTNAINAWSGNLNLSPPSTSASVVLNDGAGNPVLRTGQNGGNVDLLVQSNPNFVALDVEGSGSTANLVFVPKGTGQVVVKGGLQLTPYKVATLPACGAATVGVMDYVTDAASPSWGAALVGGGSVTIGAFCNGSAWVAG